MAVFAATLFLAIIGVFAGPSDLSFQDTYSGLMRSDDGVMTTVVWSIRVPRVVLSLSLIHI